LAVFEEKTLPVRFLFNDEAADYIAEIRSQALARRPSHRKPREWMPVRKRSKFSGSHPRPESGFTISLTKRS
jgi:hypothetical protein